MSPKLSSIVLRIVPKIIPEIAPEIVSEIIPKLSLKLSPNLYQNWPRNCPQTLLAKIVPEIVPENIPKIVPKIILKIISKTVPKFAFSLQKKINNALCSWAEGHSVLLLSVIFLKRRWFSTLSDMKKFKRLIIQLSHVKVTIHIIYH